MAGVSTMDNEAVLKDTAMGVVESVGTAML